METINDSNYELWLVRYADGELTAAERAAVEQWLESHPEAAEELAFYSEAPRLERDEDVWYTATAPGRVQPLWPAVLRWSAAAAVVALLAIPAMRWLTPQEQPVVMAQAEPETLPAVTDESIAVPVEATVVERRNAVVVRPQPEAEPLLAEAVEEAVPEESEPEVFEPLVESLFAEEVGEEIQKDEVVAEPATTVAEESIIYVDNLFTADSGTVIEQRLLAVNETIKERLQGTYLGRRLARRMPTDDELLDYTNDLRERTPQGVRMMADMVLAYNESNK